MGRVQAERHMETRKPDVGSIFGEALRLGGRAERAAYLDQACAGDQALRHELESLLKAYNQAGEFLDQTRKFKEADHVIERTGAMIGR